MVLTFLHPLPFRIRSSSCFHRVGGRRIACSANLDGPQHSIQVKNLSFSWGNGKNVFQDVSFTVAPGELCMIVGPNGCGKSTLLRTMRSILNPTAGEVFLRKPCAFVFQDPNIQILMPTIGADIALSVPKGPDTSREDVKRIVLDELEAVGLTPAIEFARKSSYRISGGQRQRAVVAAALASKPKTFLFDEATANMDPLNKAELVTRIRNIVTDRKLAAVWYV